jgi:lipoteichoic acid synthase
LHPIVIGQSINNIPITPTINHLIENGLYWEHIIDQIFVGGSSDSEFSALTGLISSIDDEMRIYQSSTFSNLPSLPRSLRTFGYDTISLHGYVGSFYDRNTNHPLLGFNKSFFSDSFSIGEKVGLGIADKDFFSQSCDLILKNNKYPFFAYLITLSTHHPYLYNRVPNAYKNLFLTNDDPDSKLDIINYMRMTRYTDDALGSFFDKIKEMGLFENSIFIIYGDHRPPIEKSSEEMTKKLTGKSLNELRFLCVPIIIVIPGEEPVINQYKNQYENVVGGLCDIYPTVMHLLGYETPFGVYGTHLFVNNDKRDPIPMVKVNNFIYNGICYGQYGEKNFKDRFGLVFINDPTLLIKDTSDLRKKYFSAIQSFRIHDFIYNSNIDLNAIQ